MFRYGMLYRGFSPSCQPMNGLIERQDDTSGKYFDILVYDRKLTENEVKNYELEEITMAKKINLIELTAETGLIKNGAKQPKAYAAFCLNQSDVDPVVIKTMDDTPENRMQADKWLAKKKNTCEVVSGNAGRFYVITAYAIEYYTADEDREQIDGSDYVPAEDEV